MTRSRHGRAGARPGFALGACALAWLCGAVWVSAAEAGAGRASASPRQSEGDELSRLRAEYRAQPDDPERAAALGLRLYRKQRLSLEAQRLLDAASRRLPKRHDLHLTLLDSYLGGGNAAAATALLARLQGELDLSRRFAFDVLYGLLQHRQFALAQAQWQRASGRVAPAAAPGGAEALFIQGLLATAAGNKDEALALFRRADSQGFPPLDSPQLLMLADCFYWLEEHKLAAATYREALDHFPQNVSARMRFGASLYWTSQLDKAREELQKALGQNPRQPEANYYLGAVLFTQKLNDRAQACFEKELALDARCDRCMSKLGYLAFMAGDDQRAASWLDKAVALSTPTPETDLVYGMIANRGGKYEVAIQHLSRVVRQFPQHAQAQFHLATAYQRSGNAEKAQQHFNLYKQLTAAESAPRPATRP